jgi:DNA-binding NarL/FixJ family response regulator
MTARSLERARARSHTAGAHAIPTRTVARRQLFGVLADAQRVTVASAPAGRTPRSRSRRSRLTHLRHPRPLIGTNTASTPPKTRSHSWSHSQKASCRVLHYVPTNLPVPKIACELVVSANTIRTHTRHLYDKLDVHTRAEAVERARELGLLAPTPRSGSLAMRKQDDL